MTLTLPVLMVSFNIRNDSGVWANEWHHSDNWGGLGLWPELLTTYDAILASDWSRLITWPEYWPLIGWPSPMSGGQWSTLPGHCHPRSTILISFWLQITLWTSLANGTSWDTLGPQEPSISTSLSVSGCHFDVDQEKLVRPPMCCVDLAGGSHHRNTGRPVDRTLVRLFHHMAMAGLIGTSWGCFVQHMTKWCEETQAGSRRHQIPRTWKAEYGCRGERGSKVFGLYWPWYWHNSSRLCHH